MSTPGTPRGSAPPHAGAQVPSSGTGDRGTRGCLSPAPGTEPCPALCPARRSPLSTDTLCHPRTAPPHPPPISTFLLFPVVSHPLSHPLPFLHAGSGLWPPPLGCDTEQQAPKAGTAKPLKDSSAPRQKAGKRLWNGTGCLVHTPGRLCCHFRALALPGHPHGDSGPLPITGAAAEVLWVPQQVPKGGCAGTLSVAGATRGLQEHIRDGGEMPGAEPASPAGLRRGVESRAHISWRMRSSPASQVEESRGDAAAQTSSTFVPVPAS